jgi:hypothetical protein
LPHEATKALLDVVFERHNNLLNAMARELPNCSKVANDQKLNGKDGVSEQPRSKNKKATRKKTVDALDASLT